MRPDKAPNVFSQGRDYSRERQPGVGTAQLPWALRVPRGPVAAGTDFEVGIAKPEKPESFLWSKPLRFRKNLNTLRPLWEIFIGVQDSSGS